MKRISALAVGAIAATALAFPGAAQAATPNPEAALAQTWLNGQLVNGVLQYASYPAANVGATIDAAMSLRALDSTADVSAEVAGVAANLDYYTDADEYDAADVLVQHGIYANGTAKALAFAESVGANGTSFGGKNLVAQLEGRVQPSGRIQDDSSYGDYANVFGQAFAAAGLAAAGSTKAASVRDFLLSQQCADGSFPEDFDRNPATDVASDASCLAAPRAGSVDATAYAVLELHGIAGTDAALAKAGAYLAGKQGPDGGWKTDDAAATENVDSTGLAARALHLLGSNTAAAKGGTWVANHQLLNLGSCRSYARSDVGALAFDDKALADTSKGTATDQYRLALSQAMPALAYAPDASVVAPRFAPAGSSIALSVAGQPVCIDGTLVRAGTPLSRTLPATTTPSIFTYVALGDMGSVRVTGLAAEKLLVNTHTKVRRNRTLKVVVAGLAAGESVTARLRTAHAVGIANAEGVASVRVKAKGRLGKARLTVTGQFANRRATAKVRVVR